MAVCLQLHKWPDWTIGIDFVSFVIHVLKEESIWKANWHCHSFNILIREKQNIYDIATDCFLSSLQFNPSAELKYQAFVIPLVPNGVKVLLNLYTIDQKSQGVCSYPSSQSCTCFKLDSSNNKIMLYQILSFLSQTFCCKKVFQLEY